MMYNPQNDLEASSQSSRRYGMADDRPATFDRLEILPQARCGQKNEIPRVNWRLPAGKLPRGPMRQRLLKRKR